MLGDFQMQWNEWHVVFGIWLSCLLPSHSLSFQFLNLIHLCCFFLTEPNKYLTTISVVAFWRNVAPWQWTWFPWSTARASSSPCRSSDLSLFSFTKLHYRPFYNSFSCVQIHNHKPHYHITFGTSNLSTKN